MRAARRVLIALLAAATTDVDAFLAETMRIGKEAAVDADSVRAAHDPTDEEP